MRAPLVSVIIPVYNAEATIAGTLDSILAQSGIPLEIICVDDCSSDASWQILRDYAKKNGMQRVVRNSVNQGAPRARNTGLSLARGEYISFVDDDDVIGSAFYRNLLDCGDADIIKGSMVQCLDGQEYRSAFNRLLEKFPRLFFQEFWTAIYRRDFLARNSLSFPEEMFPFDDAIFSLNAAALATGIKFCDTALYYYMASNASAFIRHASNLLKTRLEFARQALALCGDSESRTMLIEKLLLPVVFQCAFISGKNDRENILHNLAFILFPLNHQYSPDYVRLAFNEFLNNKIRKLRSKEFIAGFMAACEGGAL